MLSETKLEQRVVLDYGGVQILGKIIKAYGEENPYSPGMFAKINVSTPHGSIVHGGIAWFRLPTEQELTQLKEYETDAEANNRLYDFDVTKNIEY